MNGHRPNTVEDAMLRLIQKNREAEPELKKLMRYGFSKQEAIKIIRKKGGMR